MDAEAGRVLAKPFHGNDDAALPSYFSFVAKREFLDYPVPRMYLRGLGAEFVERFDPRQSVVDARRLAETVKAGIPMAFFPEGTFRHVEGLGPFHLGAFAAAVAAQVAVLPVAICGTRSVLRGGQWLPRRGSVTVTIGCSATPPVSLPDDFAAAVALREAARKHVLAHCGEYDANWS